MKLKEIAIINAGYPFRGRVIEDTNSSIIAVQMKDVSVTKGLHWPSCIPTVLTGKREPDYLRVGDILVAGRGNHNYAVLIDQSLVSLGKQAVASPHFFVVRLKSEVLTKKNILPEFLVWLLNQPPTQRHFEQNAAGTLTKSIRRSILEEVHVVVPSIDKQRAIVALSNTLSQEQRLMQQLIDNGERTINAIANDLFSKE